MDLLVQTIRKLIPLSAEDEAVVRGLFLQKIYKKGDHLLSEGEICRHITFIESGLVRYYINKDGEERTNYFNKEGEFVCDYPSFLPHVPSGVNIQALEDCTVWTISYDGIQRFYTEVRHGERFGRLGIEEVFVTVAAQSRNALPKIPVQLSHYRAAYPAILYRVVCRCQAAVVKPYPKAFGREPLINLGA